jgi:hypothetical protein
MTRATRYLLVSAVLMTGLAGAARMAEAADETATTGLHVRSSNPAIRALIVRATEQSATFRRMVETITASESVVYVEYGTCRHYVKACLVNVTGTGAHRILWVKIDDRKTDRDAMASIGHELRHTIEVLGERAVTSGAAMYLFYRREGSMGTTGAFETAAAIKAGDTVRAEMKAFRRARGN